MWGIVSAFRPEQDEYFIMCTGVEEKGLKSACSCHYYDKRDMIGAARVVS